MNRAEATILLDLPDSVHVGDRFNIEAECQVVMIRDELIDITPLDGPPDYVAGERRYELIIRNARTDHWQENADNE